MNTTYAPATMEAWVKSNVTKLCSDLEKEQRLVDQSARKIQKAVRGRIAWKRYIAIHPAGLAKKARHSKRKTANEGRLVTDDFSIAMRPQQMPQGPMMLNPRGSKRMAWDFGVVIPLLIYMIVLLPFRMLLNNDAKKSWNLAETVMDLLFCCDVVLNFRTGFVVPATDLVEYRPEMVRREYMRTWFLLDFVSSIPFGLLSLNALSQISAIRALKSSRILKTLKILRIFKISKLLKGANLLKNLDPDTLDLIEDFLATGATRSILRILRLVFIVGFVAHIMACFFIYFGKQSRLYGKDSWFLHERKEYRAKQTERGHAVMRIYLAAYYYSITTMTTIGYGDVHPWSDTERILVIILEIFGTFVFAYVISNFTSIVTLEDGNEKARRERLDAVASYIAKMAIPGDLGRRVRRYFRERRMAAMEEGSILMDLSPSLRAEVSNFLVSGGGLLNKVVLFRCCAAAYWPRVLPLLRPCPLMRGELVCKEGQDIIESFIILDGVLVGSTVKVFPDFHSSTSIFPTFPLPLPLPWPVDL